jgi:hypothetical protein
MGGIDKISLVKMETRTCDSPQLVLKPGLIRNNRRAGALHPAISLRRHHGGKSNPPSSVPCTEEEGESLANLFHTVMFVSLVDEQGRALQLFRNN